MSGNRLRLSKRAAHDLFLIVSGLLLVAWAAYQFTLFSALAGEISHEKHIDLYESVLLGLLLCFSIWIFAWRRQRELRDHTALRAEAEQRAAEAEMRALHDPLTGLGNRAKLDVSLADIVSGKDATPSSGRVALLLLDLNRFKQVNDRFGHPMGDTVLKIVALRLRSSVRATDAVFRLGGDEFAVIADDTSRTTSTHGPGFAEAAAEEIIDAIDQPMIVDRRTIAVGVSIGIAYFPQPGSTAQELMEKADIALYAAKNEGRATDRSCYRVGTASVIGLVRRNHAPG
ncbi:diguanylate cyclase (GGDEF)-like protein [Microvirga subterranea]|uniref:Diguanylate cyclase (GGDEF)-like protein n=2 Tax=Microvirga subterranea TaxID=186651 RepID=A0A370HAV6_9HYPH|nr:diguanylate cyclase (GGDEF)-like protein [Microvirga subterranea]